MSRILKMYALVTSSGFVTDLMVARVVAAAVGGCTSGGVVRDGIGGVCQLLPEPPVHILLHERVDEETGEGVESDHGLHEEKTLHLEEFPGNRDEESTFS